MAFLFVLLSESTQSSLKETWLLVHAGIREPASPASAVKDHEMEHFEYIPHSL